MIDQTRMLRNLALLFLIFEYTIAQCTQRKVPSIKTPNPLRPEEFILEETTLEMCPQSDIKKAATAVKPFDLVFSCQVASNCQAAEASFRSALARIAEALVIKRTIRINAQFRQFCLDNDVTCPSKNVLGSARPSKSYGRSTIQKSPRYSWTYYPQALYKQLLSQSITLDEPYDILSEFNAGFPFYFEQEEITPGQIDFQQTVIHEMLHGLGFNSMFVNYDSGYDPSITTRLFSPGLACSRRVDQSYMDATCTEWSGASIFDRFVHERSTGLTLFNVGVNMMSISPFGRTFQTVIDNLQGDQARSKSMQDALRMSTSNDLYFTSPNVSVKLYAPSPFIRGSSISHLDANYTNSPNFLMIHDAVSSFGKTLQNMATPGLHSIGPEIQQMLQAMGWTLTNKTATSPTIIDFEPDVDVDVVTSGAFRLVMNGVLSIISVALTMFI